MFSETEFEQIVSEAIDELPEKFRAKMNNVAILIEEFPTPETLREYGIRSKYGLYGLYEGYVQSSRRNVGVVTPDKITIFRMPILRACRTRKECQQKIIETVKHEIAHHFGSGERGARKAAQN